MTRTTEQWHQEVLEVSREYLRPSCVNIKCPTFDEIVSAVSSIKVKVQELINEADGHHFEAKKNWDLNFAHTLHVNRFKGSAKDLRVHIAATRQLIAMTPFDIDNRLHSGLGLNQALRYLTGQEKDIHDPYEGGRSWQVYVKENGYRR